MNIALIGLKLLGIGRWLKEALGAFIKWAGRDPWQAAVIALCAFSGWLWWHDSRVIAGRDKTIHVASEQIKNMTAASEQNHLAQYAQKARFEQFYKGLAHEADLEHKAQLADANNALAEYIRTHRVRAAAPGSGFSPAGSAAESGGSAVPASLSPDTFVAVSDDDMHRCTALATYALDAHNWAVKLGQ